MAAIAFLEEPLCTLQSKIKPVSHLLVLESLKKIDL